MNFGLAMVKTLLCGTVYSVIVAYFVMRVVRLFFNSETKKLYKYMIILLWIVAILFTIYIFGIELNDVIVQIKSIKATNIGTEIGLEFTYVFTVIKFMINSIPSIVSILVTYLGIMFINEFSIRGYSEITIKVSENLSRLCKTGLIVTVCSNAAFNLLQLIFIHTLRKVNSFIQIPIYSVAFVLAALIFSRMVITNKILKDDNDSII